MKELSIAEKAKRYGKALKEAVVAHKDEDKHLKATLERIFPELKESEDERIRKALYLFVEAYGAYSQYATQEDMLAWLEKQGEHANFINKIQIGDKVTRNEDGVLVNLSQLNRVAKPTDKVEPRFKVGDWITNSKCTWKIDSIDEDMYYNNHCGIDCGGDIKSIDEEYHLWTIQDARDGDILSDRYSIVIFRGIGNEKWKDVIDYHIGLFTNSQHLVVQKGLSHWGRINALHPAIKEQRDTLMKAMADSGYEWDAEKKELKKIEQTPNDEIGNYDHGKVLDALMSAKKTPEPAWSEEDENIRQWIISDIKKLLYLSKKSHVIANKELDWLKSLKERYTWKPSDEQMKLLREVQQALLGKDCHNRFADFMYELKRLREE